MTVFVPTWLLWTLGLLIGVPMGLIFVALAVFGAMAAHALKDGIWK